MVHTEDGERTGGVVVALENDLRAGTLDIGYRVQVSVSNLLVANEGLLQFLLNYAETKAYATQLLARPSAHIIEPTNAFPIHLMRLVAEAVISPTLSWTVPRVNQVKERLRSRVQTIATGSRNLILHSIPPSHTIGVQQLIRLSRPSDRSSRSIVTGLRRDHFQISYNGLDFDSYDEYSRHHIASTEHVQSEIDFFFNSSLLQPIEVQSLSSFLGTRVHHLLLLHALYGAQLKSRLRSRGVVQFLFSDSFLTEQQCDYFTSSAGLLDQFVHSLAQKVEHELSRLDVVLVGVELPVCDPYKLYTNTSSDKASWCETRVDSLGINSQGEVCLIEYKAVWVTDATEFKPLKSAHVHQVLLNAWLLFLTYHIIVDQVIIIFTSRHGDVLSARMPFRPTKHKDIRSQRLLDYFTNYQTGGQYHYLDSNQVFLRAKTMTKHQKYLLEAWATGQDRILFVTRAHLPGTKGASSAPATEIWLMKNSVASAGEALPCSIIAMATSFTRSRSSFRCVDLEDFLYQAAAKHPVINSKATAVDPAEK